MTLSKIGYKVVSGGDVMAKVKKIFADFIKSDNVFVLPMAAVLGIAMKHCTNDVQRGEIVAAMRNYKVDLSKSVSDTTRMPQVTKPVDQNKVSKGLRARVFRQGNRLSMTVDLDSVPRMIADLLTSKKSPLAAALLQALINGGLKPVIRGAARR